MIHWTLAVLIAVVPAMVGLICWKLEREKVTFYRHLYDQEHRDAWQRTKDIQNAYRKKLKSLPTPKIKRGKK